MVIATEKAGGPEKRKTSLAYHMGSGGGAGYSESSLVATLDDLPDEDRKPRHS
ncbi:hypothetical protein D3C87_2139450 [compost metagenome]